MTLDWRNGLPFSARFGDVYFSVDSGLEETRHVFIEGNRLTERFAALRPGQCFTLGETGFGTGLNFLCTQALFEQVAPAGTTLDFLSVEKFPLEEQGLRKALALWPALQPQADALLQAWRRRVPGWNRWSFGRVRLTLILDDIETALPEVQPDCVDSWFLDGFSPAKNPEMWSPSVMAELARISRPGATLATYTSAGWVRRGLQQAGFAIERLPGFGRKREMLRGVFGQAPDVTTLSPSRPHSALVIGGGIAGCAAAHALAQRGVPVTLLEASAQLASGASGNPRGILHARFSAGMNPLHRFVLASYGHALGLLDRLLPVDGILRDECGLLQLDFSETEQQRIGRLAAHDWPESLMQFVDANQASAHAGITLLHGGLWFPGGGWIVPSAFCERLISADTHLVPGHTVKALIPMEGGWRASGQTAAGQDWQMEAGIVVVACAHAARQLAPCSHLPLTPVRGQISSVPATPGSQTLRAVICGDGYCTPAQEGIHVLGATHAFDDESLALRAEDHATNLDKLETFAPELRAALGHLDINRLAGRAAIRCSAPGALPFVGEIQPGLYCSLAHGTRGLLTAGLSGELLAAQACSELLPLPQSVVAALSPHTRQKSGG
jgi:tRNA 5-methylaminomethyl-2-thiouridine biosynthesis bifunctional protein